MQYVSYRQTRSGDWLIFSAVPAVRGVGLGKSTDVKPGYTTGHQFGRRSTKQDAEEFAEYLAQELGVTVVEWRPPEPTEQFINLPRRYPEHHQYTSEDEATAAGWVWIAPGKTIEWYRGVKIRCVDTGLPVEFGYDAAIMALGETFAQAETVWIDGRFSVRFRMGDVVDAIERARVAIDDDLISQLEAATLAGVSISTIHNAIRDGRLSAYPNDRPATSDIGERPSRGPLVSRREVRRTWSRRKVGP